MEKEELWVGGRPGGCSLRSQNVNGLWIDVKQGTTASNDWINFKLLSGHTFMKATKSDQFCDPLHPLYSQKFILSHKIVDRQSN